MEQTSCKNSFLIQSFVCPLCRRSIQFVEEHLKHFHKITEKEVVEKLLNYEQFSTLKICSKDSNIEPVISFKCPKKDERSKQKDAIFNRFLCKHCHFVNKYESVMVKHFEKKHSKMARPPGKNEGHWKKQRMNVCLSRIDQVLSKMFRNIEKKKQFCVIL